MTDEQLTQIALPILEQFTGTGRHGAMLEVSKAVAAAARREALNQAERKCQEIACRRKTSAMTAALCADEIAALIDQPAPSEPHHVEDVRAMVSADAKDAARYRWLRNLPVKGLDHAGMHIHLAKRRPEPNGWIVDSVRCEALDTAIDDAMQGKP